MESKMTHCYISVQEQLLANGEKRVVIELPAIKTFSKNHFHFEWMAGATNPRSGTKWSEYNIHLISDSEISAFKEVEKHYEINGFEIKIKRLGTIGDVAAFAASKLA